VNDRIGQVERFGADWSAKVSRTVEMAKSAFFGLGLFTCYNPEINKRKMTIYRNTIDITKFNLYQNGHPALIVRGALRCFAE